jgi:hypothetical protein
MDGNKHDRNAAPKMTPARNKCLRTGGILCLGVLNDEKRGIATGQVFPGNQRQLTVPRLMIAVKKAVVFTIGKRPASLEIHG